MHFSLCSELSSEHLPVLTDVKCWLSLKAPLIHPDITQLNWPAFCAGFKGCSRIIPRKTTRKKINTCDENLISSVYVTEVVLALKFLICDHLGPRLPVSIQGKLRLKNELNNSRKVSETRLLIPDTSDTKSEGLTNVARIWILRHGPTEFMQDNKECDVSRPHDPTCKRSENSKTVVLVSVCKRTVRTRSVWDFERGNTFIHIFKPSEKKFCLLESKRTIRSPR